MEDQGCQLNKYSEPIAYQKSTTIDYAIYLEVYRILSATLTEYFIILE